MDDCDYLRPHEMFIASLCGACIWGAFTLLWLLVAVCIPRPASLSMDMLVAFTTFAKCAAGFIVAFLPIYCVWDMDLGYIPLALIAALSQAMSTILELLISRGYGITRYTLTLTEMVMFILCSVLLTAALLFPLLALLYLVIYVMFIIYSCRTLSLLSLQNPAFSDAQNKAIRVKKQVFLSMILIVVAAILCTIALGVTQVATDDDRNYRVIYVVGYCFIELLFAGELLMLQMRRSDPIYSNPLVMEDEVYLVRQSLVERRQEPIIPPASGLPYQPAFNPYASPQPAYGPPQQGNVYPSLPGQYADRRY